MKGTIRMRRPSKHGSKASKSGCYATTSLQQTVSAIGASALVGDTGAGVIERLLQAVTWVEIKEELCSVLGEGEPRKRAFENLSQYKPRGKGVGEMAFDITAKAAIATNDADLQMQLGLKAFLQNVPESIGHELRRWHFASVREALAEAHFLQSVEEDENCGKRQVFHC